MSISIGPPTPVIFTSIRIRRPWPAGRALRPYVLVAAELAPHDAWQQPILRLADTAIGVAVGIAAAWIGLRVLRRQLRSFARKINGDAGGRANSQARRGQVVNPLALARPGPADVPANRKQA